MEQLALFEGGKNTDDSTTRHMKKFHDYDAFVEKFKPKKTTDDCYTPQIVYDAVTDYVAKSYNLDKDTFIRPFWPGEDYKTYDYKPGAVVVDNPPFSILSQIVQFYHEHNINFFLFAPAITVITKKNYEIATFIFVNASITYANGATVQTGFITNLEPHEICCKSEPALYRIIDDANKRALKEKAKPELPKYSYPDCFTYAPEINSFSRLGIPFQLKRSDVYCIDKFDSQRAVGKGIYGRGFLLSEKARIEAEKARIEAEKARIEAEKARIEAEKAKPRIVWELSEREKEIIRNLGKEDDQQKNETL